MITPSPASPRPASNAATSSPSPGRLPLHSPARRCPPSPHYLRHQPLAPTLSSPAPALPLSSLNCHLGPRGDKALLINHTTKPAELAGLPTNALHCVTVHSSKRTQQKLYLQLPRLHLPQPLPPLAAIFCNHQRPSGSKPQKFPSQPKAFFCPAPLQRHHRTPARQQDESHGLPRLRIRTPQTLQLPTLAAQQK